MRRAWLVSVLLTGSVLLMPSPALPEAANYDLAAKAYTDGDFAAARLLAERAAKAGDTEAQLMYAFMASEGKGGPINDDDAVHWYTQVSKNQDKDAYYALALLARDERGGLKRTYMPDYLQHAASNGHAGAARQLAELYYTGADGLAADTSKMLQWLEVAADLKDPQATYALGIFLADGEGDIKANPRKARKYLRQAHKMGVVDATVDYGMFLYQGRGGYSDKPRAAEIWQKAAEKGDVGAMFLLAYVLAKGEGVVKDVNSAYKLLLIADKTDSDVEQEDRQKLKAALEKIIPEDKLQTMQEKYKK